MKAKDLINLLKNFERTGIKNGDLVITAEIHRVVDRDWGKKHGSVSAALVSTIWPVCNACSPNECCHPRVMQIGVMHEGQQAVMKLVKRGAK